MTDTRYAVLDIRLDLQDVHVEPYEYSECRLLAFWDIYASKTDPVPADDIYRNWKNLVASSGSRRPTIEDESRVAGMAIFNADSIAQAAQSKHV